MVDRHSIFIIDTLENFLSVPQLFIDIVTKFFMIFFLNLEKPLSSFLHI